MLASVTHILPLTLLRRARLLPTAGRVLVRAGQKVTAADVIAEGSSDGSHTLVDIRRSLGISRVDEAEKLVERRVGEKVQKGDILAQMGSLLPRVVRAPVDGVVAAISAGQVLLESSSGPRKVLAGFDGIVDEIIPDRGAIVSGSGALVQGVWGNDRVQTGMLLVVAKSPDEELARGRLDESMRGAVLLGGHCAHAEVLRAAAELPLRGLILGSLRADLIPTASALDFPVIVLDGFGRLPINEAAYRVLSTNERRDACLNAASFNPFSGDRPEVVISLPADGTPAVEAVDFKAGQMVRIIGAPYASRVGTLMRVLPGQTRLATGILAPAGVVRLGSDEDVVIPLVNLDVLE